MRLKNNKFKHFYLSESARVHRPETAVSIMLSKPQRMTPLTKIQRCSKWFSVIRYFPIEAVYFFLNLLDGVKTWQYSQPFLSETWVKRKKQCGRTCISWQNAARTECFLYLKLCCHLIKHMKKLKVEITLRSILTCLVTVLFQICATSQLTPKWTCCSKPIWRFC